MGTIEAGSSTPETRTASRLGQRVTARLTVEVAGQSRGFGAQTVDISRTGVLLYLDDDRFIPSDEIGNIILYSERVEEEFGDGFEVRLSADLAFEAEVVRVSRREGLDDGPMLMACRYARPMTEPEWASLGFTDEMADPLIGNDLVPAAPPPQAPAAPAVERKASARDGDDQPVEILSEYAAYRAIAVNLSPDGALLEMTDPAFFAGQQGSDRLQVCTDRLAVQFGNGMRVRFRDADLSVDAEIVRVGEKQKAGGATIVVGCRFLEPLRAAACKRLGLEPPVDDPDDKFAPRADSRVSDLLRSAHAAGATDLHIKAGSPPRARVGGRLINLTEESLDAIDTDVMALDLMAHRHQGRFGERGYVQFAVALEGCGRFRVNVLRHEGRAVIAVRCLPEAVPNLKELGVGADVRGIAKLESGLVLVAGHAGSGRSTFLAGLVSELNRTRSCHVVTLEEQIEFVHAEDRAHVTQRDLTCEGIGWAPAIRQALHLDADVVVLGELNEAPALHACLDAADTGLLVVASMQGGNVADSLSSLLDLVPERRRNTVRGRLERALHSIVMLRLEHDDAGANRLDCVVHRHRAGEPV
ncbi:MAG: ATPase, T2SS/T4P/T4SS family [Planctomycetota bacterium]|jgi:twitching motility protein PilT